MKQHRKGNRQAVATAAVAELIAGRAHELKSWPEHFAASSAGLKPFEIRRNDRDFRAGDHLTLREWIPLGNGDGRYTGRDLQLVVIYVVRDAIGVQEGYVAMSVQPAGL